MQFFDEKKPNQKLGLLLLIGGLALLSIGASGYYSGNGSFYADRAWYGEVVPGIVSALLGLFFITDFKFKTAVESEPDPGVRMVKVVCDYAFSAIFVVGIFVFAAIAIGVFLYPSVCNFDVQVKGSPQISADGMFTVSEPANFDYGGFIGTSGGPLNLTLTHVSASIENGQTILHGQAFCRDLELAKIFDYSKFLN